ncbi:MAG: GtrA family protein [Saccharofermentanales bacterium]|jgi:putative flippase GtrA|nr:GtrA family protein [Bacillota bacterium]NLB09261.1 GtrA family protein [Clostridiales bacterium]
MRGYLAKLRALLSRAEVLRYLIIGVLTTLVNIGIIALGNRYLGLDWLHITNKVAYVSAILFAYITNRIYVFRSQEKVWPELIRFVAARFVVSFIFEDLGLYLIYDVLGYQKMMPILKHVPWAKFFGMAGVIIANYLVGKLLVFTRRPGADDELS